MIGRFALLGRLVAAVVLSSSLMPRHAAAQDCRVTTEVRLVNQHQQPVLDITADQLKADIAGKPAKVVTLSRAANPGLILLIDASSSMKGTWNEVIAAARQLADSAKNGVAAVVFRENIEAYAEGRSEIDKLLDQLSTRTFSLGGTALYDTLIEIAGRVRTRSTALLVISDGEDNSSTHSSDETIKLFLKSSWPAVFGLIVDYDHQYPRRGYFKKIAAATGGLIAVPSSASKVPEAVNELAAEAYTPFTLTLQPIQPIAKMAKLKLEVVGPDNKPRRDIRFAQVAEVAGCDPILTSPGKPE